MTTPDQTTNSPSPSSQPSPPSTLLQATSPSPSPSPPTTPLLSDLPHARRTHTTTGYRAGLTTAKALPGPAQSGFDAGYPLGAALGMRVGFLRGFLGIVGGGGEVGGDVGDEINLGMVEKEMELEELLRGMRGLGLVEGEGEGDLGRVVVEGSPLSHSQSESQSRAQEEHQQTSPTAATAPPAASESQEWLEDLESIRKWSDIVRDLGTKVGVDFAASIGSLGRVEREGDGKEER